jgi:hypothetical protein
VLKWLSTWIALPLPLLTFKTVREYIHVYVLNNLSEPENPYYNRSRPPVSLRPTIWRTMAYCSLILHTEETTAHLRDETKAEYVKLFIKLTSHREYEENKRVQLFNQAIVCWVWLWLLLLGQVRLCIKWVVCTMQPQTNTAALQITCAPRAITPGGQFPAIWTSPH